MKSIRRDDLWHPHFCTPPECQGQMVEYSYNACNACIVERRAGADRSVTYTAYGHPEDAGPFEPWNRVPDLGPEIGPCEIVDR